VSAAQNPFAERGDLAVIIRVNRFHYHG
jgi:hypothetical protein